MSWFMICNSCEGDHTCLDVRSICDDCWDKFNNWIIDNEGVDDMVLCSCR